MNYIIEFGNFVDSEWKAYSVMSFKDDFKAAKKYLIEMSTVFVNENDYIVGAARMIDDSDTIKPPRVIHYITRHHPNVSLPSTR